MRVVQGKEDYLFHDAENIFQLLATPLSFVDAENWKELSAFRASECRRIAGSEYLTLACPEKACVFSHLLPEGTIISPERPAPNLVRCIGNRFIYPFFLLSHSCSIRPTYGPNESHWNDYGAYLVYAETMRRLAKLSGRDLYILPEPNFELVEGKGQCDIGPSVLRWTLTGELSGQGVFDNLLWSRGNVKVFTNPNSSLPTLLLFRDSFAGTLLQYLMGSFSRIVAISSWHCLWDVVKYERASFVVVEFAERYTIPWEYVNRNTCWTLCKMTTKAIGRAG